MSISRGTVNSKGQAWSSSLLRYIDLSVDASGNLNVAGSGGGGGGAVTIADGAAVTIGALADAAVTTSASGSLSAKLRGLVAIFSSVWDSVAGVLNVSVAKLKLTPVSGSVSSSGNNTVLTPTSGKKLRIYYLSYNPANPVDIAFRFGAAGPLFLRNNIVQGGSIIAKDFGDARYVEGAVDETLVLNLSSAVTAIWNAFYVEI